MKENIFYIHILTETDEFFTGCSAHPLGGELTSRLISFTAASPVFQRSVAELVTANNTDASGETTCGEHAESREQEVSVYGTDATQ